MKSAKFRMVLYVAAGIFFFVFWLVWVFPTDALKSRILTEIENQTQGRYKFDVGSLDIGILGSITFNDLKVSEGVGDTEKTLLKTPKLKLSFSPLALGSLAKKPDIDFYIKGSKGQLEGNYHQDGDEFDLTASFKQFPIADLGMISAKAKIDLTGSLDGDIDLRLNKADTNKNEGSIDLRLIDLTMASTRVALDPTAPDQAMEIPQIKLTGAKDSGIKGEVKKENLEISAIDLKGGDLDLNLSGRVVLQGAKASDYRLALQGGFSLTEALAKALPILFIIEQQKNPQGVYPLNMTGRLGKPSIRVGTFNLPI
ncbi:MAG: type II secretion system protein GspN [Deltaproteobacteria bacterium]|nr:type II secretion system protein GspN [Deltaproteobacteria bacterium]